MDSRANRIFQLFENFHKNHCKTLVLVFFIYVFFFVEFVLNYYFNVPKGLSKSFIDSLIYRNNTNY